MYPRHRRRLFPVAPLLAALLCGASAAAHADAGDRWTLGMHFENDLFADEDQQYTNGIKLTVVSPDLTSAFHDRELLPGWARRLIPHIPFIRDKGATRTLAFSLGQNMYTPQDTAASVLLPTDRPYAGWLYLATTFQTRDTDRQDTFDVQLGLVGPYSFAEQTQDLVHRIRGIPIAQGWNNQIRSEPGIVLAYERVLRYTLGGSPHGLSADLLPRFGAAVGNIATYASAGAQLRAGWNLPPDFGYSVIRPGGTTQVDSLRDRYGGDPPALSQPRGFSAYLFAGAGGRAVLRDIFLNGNTFRDSHEVDHKLLVGDLIAGITLGYGEFKLSLAQVLRTREFDGQTRDHRFGSITLNYAF
jgi:hypothetical protein